MKKQGDQPKPHQWTPTDSKQVRRPKLQQILHASVAAVLVISLLLAGTVSINVHSRHAALSTLPRGLEPAAEGYKQVYDVIRNLHMQRTETRYTAAGQALDDFVMNTDATPVSSEGKRGNYSDTNLQVAGVQEADIVKTDGEYIYALSLEYLYIVEADDGRLTLVSKVPLSSSHPGENGEKATLRMVEIFIYGDRLIALSQETRHNALAEVPSDDLICGCYSRYQVSALYAEYYDISDRTHPRLVNRLGQSGYYLSARMIGSYVYIATSHYTGGSPEEENPATFVPQLFSGTNGKPIHPEDIGLVSEPQEPRYLVVTGADAEKPEAHVSAKAVLDGGETLYANAEHLYVAHTRFTGDANAGADQTQLVKFSTSDGRVEAVAAGSVKGALLNQFSMDEHAGIFRIVTTENRWWTSGGGSHMQYHNETGNHLFVLDDELNAVGSLEHLAKDERVYSVRFDGDTAYFVTFRQVDPLFTVDLTDPSKPEILSALKIPGFSDYLHPYAQGRLFGFGQDADPQTGRINGLKLAMFDTSDPRNVTQRHTFLLGESYAWSEASDNHKAILVSPDRSLIAFRACGERNAYLLFSYQDADGFAARGEIDIADYVGEDQAWGSLRGLYIGDYFYVAGQTCLASFRLSDLTACSTLKMDRMHLSDDNEE